MLHAVALRRAAPALVTQCHGSGHTKLFEHVARKDLSGAQKVKSARRAVLQAGGLWC